MDVANTQELVCKVIWKFPKNNPKTCLEMVFLDSFLSIPGAINNLWFQPRREDRAKDDSEGMMMYIPPLPHRTALPRKPQVSINGTSESVVNFCLGDRDTLS